MKIMKRTAGVLGALALAGGIVATLGAPAAAHHNEIQTQVETEGCWLSGTTSWAKDDHQAGAAVLVFRVDGVVATVAIGEGFEFLLPDHTTLVEWRIWGGGERDYDSPALTNLDALLAHLDGGGGVLDADAPGVAWHQLDVTGCGPEVDPSPDPTPSATPSPDPTTGATAGPTVGPETTPASGSGGGAEQLAATGSPVPGIVLVGLLLAGTGVLLVWAVRRKRTSFTA